MKNRIVQTLIGLACSVVLVIGVAGDVKASIVKKDAQKIDYDKLYDIQLGARALDAKSDYVGLVAEDKLINDYKISIDDKIVDDIKIANMIKAVDDIKVDDNVEILVNTDIEKADNAPSLLLNSRFSEFEKVKQVDLKAYQLKDGLVNITS